MAERVYVDSCVFINVFSDGSGDAQELEWLPHGVWLLEEGQAGRLDIVTSPFTIAEVLGQGKIRGTHIARAERESRVAKARDYFADNPITYVELDESLGDPAGQLAVTLQLSGPDAIHLASALAAQCVTLFTWDRDLLRCDGQSGVGDLSVAKPEISGQLRLEA